MPDGEASRDGGDGDRGVDTGTPKTQTVDVVGRPIANNNICQSGTTCVATGEDRRLGDFFTNAVDERGCVLVGPATRRSQDPVTGGERDVALPLFVRQTSGRAWSARATAPGRTSGQV